MANSTEVGEIRIRPCIDVEEVTSMFVSISRLLSPRLAVEHPN